MKHIQLFILIASLNVSVVIHSMETVHEMDPKQFVFDTTKKIVESVANASTGTKLFAGGLAACGAATLWLGTTIYKYLCTRKQQAQANPIITDSYACPHILTATNSKHQKPAEFPADPAAQAIYVREQQEFLAESLKHSLEYSVPIAVADVSTSDDSKEKEVIEEERSSSSSTLQERIESFKDREIERLKSTVKGVREEKEEYTKKLREFIDANQAKEELINNLIQVSREQITTSAAQLQRLQQIPDAQTLINVEHNLVDVSKEIRLFNEYKKKREARRAEKDQQKDALFAMVQGLSKSFDSLDERVKHLEGAMLLLWGRSKNALDDTIKRDSPRSHLYTSNSTVQQMTIKAIYEQTPAYRIEGTSPSQSSSGEILEQLKNRQRSASLGSVSPKNSTEEFTLIKRRKRSNSTSSISSHSSSSPDSLTSPQNSPTSHSPIQPQSPSSPPLSSASLKGWTAIGKQSVEPSVSINTPSGRLFAGGNMPRIPLCTLVGGSSTRSQSVPSSVPSTKPSSRQGDD